MNGVDQGGHRGPHPPYRTPRPRYRLELHDLRHDPGDPEEGIRRLRSLLKLAKRLHGFAAVTCEPMEGSR
jgi:hypothetical protein